jgi:hypothetical protein
LEYCCAIGWLAIAESDRVLAGAGVNVQSQLPRTSHGGIAVTTAPVNGHTLYTESVRNAYAV